MLVELFGILANLTPMDLPANQSWAKMLQATSDAKPDMSLLDLIIRIITAGTAHYDMILETVLLIGTITNDSLACKIIARSALIKSLFKLWKDFPSSEVEVHLQLLYCFYKYSALFNLVVIKLTLYSLSTQEPTQDACLKDTKLLNFIIDFLPHKNEAIRHLTFAITEISRNI